MVSSTNRDLAVAFVIPYFDDGQSWRRNALQRTLGSIERQTDDRWHVYLVDDCSPERSVGTFLRQCKEMLPGRLDQLQTVRNAGPGQARNLGVQVAHGDGLPVIAFLDSDDQAHPERVRTVREMFTADPELDFVYTDVDFVDEDNLPWDVHDLLPALKLIQCEQQLPKLRGRERWIEQAVERDCMAIPSAMNLHAGLALKYPFPDVRFCEDVATLFRYLGSGAKIDHAAGIPVRYRVPRQGGSAARALSGDLEFYNRQRCVNERAGLEEAIAEALSRGATDHRQGREVLCRYLIRIGRTVAGDGNIALGVEQLREAYSVDPDTFGRRATALECQAVHGGLVSQ
ncbi:glycosyltransferase family 2 protein [Micromonospora sp. Llam7]|uniref:glycosyltransferase family 2 protein n=1 Tax=Micromonospora tarapacensis TaxID=2835305 RepID=UPI001C82D4B9|nr:glycosyltransferase family A protein [Micromonospora tarapacensis]MBX7267730.1 glycosyltransferase family 2 protein [Micromonospora tarapacensis]